MKTTVKKNNVNTPKLQKPFLKWVGGKTQIIDKIIQKFPSECNNYHELFLGGGSVLFALLSLQKHNKITIHNKIYAYDLNFDLINAYKHIQQNKDELYQHIKFYLDTYVDINGTEVNRKPENIEDALTSKESYYYWLRQKYNNIEKGTVECSALFIFINKTCFRGMYREGPNGFNVPYGHYKTITNIINEEELDTISDLIQDVEFIHSNFCDSIKNINEGDFVYMDPPYAPENETSFVGYNLDGFDLETHELLFNEIKNLENIKFIMSNSNVPLVIEHFENYEKEEIIARRAINAKNPAATTKEVIIYN